MSKFEKNILLLLSGSSDANFKFKDIQNILNNLGFENRIKGSHHIYYKNGIDEIFNIQPDGAMAKSYQVKQIRNIILKYKLIKNAL